MGTTTCILHAVTAAKDRRNPFTRIFPAFFHKARRIDQRTGQYIHVATAECLQHFAGRAFPVIERKKFLFFSLDRVYFIVVLKEHLLSFLLGRFFLQGQL